MSKGKFLIEAYKSYDANKVYNYNDAVDIILKNKRSKINETIEICLNLGVDPRHADQMVRGTVNLPNGSGKEIRVVVFAKDKNAEDAKKEGADVIGSDDLVQKIQDGFLDFDRVIASPDMMGTVSKVAKILGPKGLMPNPKVGTVTPDVESAVKNAKAGQVRYRADKTGIVHCSIGKGDFEASKLVENLQALMSDLNKAKPASAKGIYVKKVTVSSTMGVGVQIDQGALG